MHNICQNGHNPLGEFQGRVKGNTDGKFQTVTTKIHSLKSLPWEIRTTVFKERVKKVTKVSLSFTINGLLTEERRGRGSSTHTHTHTHTHPICKNHSVPVS